MIYFTSDLHLFGDGECRVGERQFDGVQEKNLFLINQWNCVVGKDDEVYLLGDISDGTGIETNEVLKKLNGMKYLIIGNHEKYLDDPQFDRSLYIWCKQYYELHTRGTKFVLFHYPIEIWSGYKNDRVHLHGHMHSPSGIHTPIRRYDVGVNAHDGMPISIDEIWASVKELHNVELKSRWHGLIIKESLTSEEILDYLSIDNVEIWKTENTPRYWTAIQFHSEVDDFPEKLAKVVTDREKWYVDLNDKNEKVIVVKNQVFRYEIGNQKQKEMVLEACRNYGIPEEQLDWSD